MNNTNEEFEMMMQSLKDREQAMRILRILKQGEKAEDAGTSAECRMQNAESGTSNERSAECRMQNAESKTESCTNQDMVKLLGSGHGSVLVSKAQLFGGE